MTASTCLILVRGLPGAGKSTFGGLLSHLVVAADDYMVDDTGGYRYDASRLGECHAACQGEVDRLLEYIVASHVVVANTFSQRWEMEPYFRLAEEQCATVHVVDLFDAESIARMRARWEHDWKNGDPRPPRERG